MNIAELIAALKAFDPNLEVFVEDSEFIHGQTPTPTIQRMNDDGIILTDYTHTQNAYDLETYYNQPIEFHRSVWEQIEKARSEWQDPVRPESFQDYLKEIARGKIRVENAIKEYENAKSIIVL